MSCFALMSSSVVDRRRKEVDSASIRYSLRKKFFRPYSDGNLSIADRFTAKQRVFASAVTDADLFLPSKMLNSPNSAPLLFITATGIPCFSTRTAPERRKYNHWSFSPSLMIVSSGSYSQILLSFANRPSCFVLSFFNGERVVNSWIFWTLSVKYLDSSILDWLQRVIAL